MIKEVKDGVCTLSDGESISANELVSLIGGSLNKKTKIFKIPKLL